MKTSITSRSTTTTRILACSIATMLAAHSAQAATGTWNGPTLTGNWDTTDTN